MSNNSFDYLLKFIIVGPTGVGKSSLLLQFTDGEFSGEHELTVGVEFGVRLMTINDLKVKLQIWDTAGQESFRAITSNYYRGSHGALLVYDITRRDTFNYLQSWLEEIRSQSAQTSPNITIVLVGNKSDLESKRVVSYSEGEQFAKDNDLSFIETSAKQKTNVEEAFMLSSKDICTKLQQGTISIQKQSDTILKTAPKQQSSCPCS